MSDKVAASPLDVQEQASDPGVDWEQSQSDWDGREAGDSIVTDHYRNLGAQNSATFTVAPFNEDVWTTPNTSRNKTANQHFAPHSTGPGGVVDESLRASVKRIAWLRWNRQTPADVLNRHRSKQVAWPSPGLILHELATVMRFVNWVHAKHHIKRLSQVERTHITQFRRTLPRTQADRFTRAVDVTVAFNDDLLLQDRLPTPDWSTSDNPQQRGNTGSGVTPIMEPDTAAPLLMWTTFASSGVPADDLLRTAEFARKQTELWHTWTCTRAQHLEAIAAMNNYVSEHGVLPAQGTSGRINVRYLATLYQLPFEAFRRARDERQLEHVTGLPVADGYYPTLPITAVEIKGRHPAYAGPWFTPIWGDLTLSKTERLLPVERVICGLCFAAIALQAQAPRGSELRLLENDCLEEAFREDGSRQIAITVARYAKGQHHRQKDEHEATATPTRLVVTNVAERAVQTLLKLNAQRGDTSGFLFPGRDGAMSSDEVNGCLEAAVAFTRRLCTEQNLGREWWIEPPPKEGVTSARFRKVTSVAMALHSGLDDAAEGLGHVFATTTSRSYALVTQKWFEFYEQAENAKSGSRDAQTAIAGAHAAFMSQGRVSGQGIQGLGDILDSDPGFGGATMTNRQLVLQAKADDLNYYENSEAGIGCLVGHGHLAEAPCLTEKDEAAQPEAPRMSLCVGTKCRFSVTTDEGVQKFADAADRMTAEADELDAEADRLAHMPLASTKKAELLIAKAARKRRVAKTLRTRVTKHQKNRVELVVDLTDQQGDKRQPEDPVSLQQEGRQ